MAKMVDLKTESKPAFLRRSRIDILACILENSVSGSRKTRLIYGCNLSLPQFNQYMNYLVESQLVKVSRQGGVEIFETTEKAREFLRDYGKIRAVLDRMRS